MLPITPISYPNIKTREFTVDTNKYKQKRIYKQLQFKNLLQVSYNGMNFNFRFLGFRDCYTWDL